jgi:serine/threonine protein kinase
LGDFRLLELLGEGAFGKAFLAEQVSLRRQVALKVTADRGGEARTLGSLEHDHIVRVFSEAVLPGPGLRLLRMQYVPGSTLEPYCRGRAVLPSYPGLPNWGPTPLRSVRTASARPPAVPGPR